jgi:hypothetical protein
MYLYYLSNVWEWILKFRNDFDLFQAIYTFLLLIFFKSSDFVDKKDLLRVFVEERRAFIYKDSILESKQGTNR